MRIDDGGGKGWGRLACSYEVEKTRMGRRKRMEDGRERVLSFDSRTREAMAWAERQASYALFFRSQLEIHHYHLRSQGRQVFIVFHNSSHDDGAERRDAALDPSFEG